MITRKQFQSVNKPQTVSLDIMKAKGTLFYKTLRYTFTPPHLHGCVSSVDCQSTTFLKWKELRVLC